MKQLVFKEFFFQFSDKSKVYEYATSFSFFFNFHPFFNIKWKHYILRKSRIEWGEERRKDRIIYFSFSCDDIFPLNVAALNANNFV